MSEKLKFLECQMCEARDGLHEALKSANRLALFGTVTEIQKALSHVRDVIYEIGSKEQPEFAPFRTSEASENHKADQALTDVPNSSGIREGK